MDRESPERGKKKAIVAYSSMWKQISRLGDLCGLLTSNKSCKMFEEVVRRQQQSVYDSFGWHKTSTMADGMTFLHRELIDTVPSFETTAWKGRSGGASITRCCFLSRSCTFYSNKGYENKGHTTSVMRTPKVLTFPLSPINTGFS